MDLRAPETLQPPSPKPRRRWKWAALVAVVAPLAAITVAYVLYFTPDSPSRLRLSAQAVSTAQPAMGVPVGRWSVGSGSVAGYRVREKLLSLPASNDAVGRTEAVTGTFELDRSPTGDIVVRQGMRVDVDVSTLASDQARRDEHMHTMALESDRFPTAGFVTTADIVLPAAAASGGPMTLNAQGDLTVHGVTRPVSIPLQAQRDGDRIEVVGSLTLNWAQFGMTRPDLSYVSVESDPTFEWQLFFDPPA
jgi:polyisoprenoid-binding protein YceI